MQNYYKYIRYFKLKGPYNADFIQGFENQFKAFHYYYQDNLPVNPFGYVEYQYGKGFDNSPLYTKLTISIAEYFGVKLLCRDMLNIENKPVKGLFIIGDEVRVNIVLYLFNYFEKVISSYKTNNARLLKSQGVKNPYSSYYYEPFFTNITNTINNLLVIDLRYTQYLEKYVLTHFKLEPKIYRGQVNITYDNLVTKRYYHKRMLL